MTLKRRKPTSKEATYARLVAEETLIFDVTEEISRALANDQLTRTELAERLGKSKGFVTQILSGERNMTLRTVADLAFVLDRRFQVRAVPTQAAVGRPDQPYHLYGGAEETRGYKRVDRGSAAVHGTSHFYGGTGVDPAGPLHSFAGPDQEGPARADHEFTLAA